MTDKITQKNNFIYLFIALVSLLFSMSLLKQIESSWLEEIVEVIVLGVLILGVHSLKSERPWMHSVYVMIAVMISSFIVKKIFGDSHVLEYMHLVILLVFFTGSFYLSIVQVAMSEEVNQNMIVGSIVLYLLLALIWTIIYLLILSIFSDSFNGLEQLPWQENFSNVAYFSFVTLTTLGYGDISPNNSISEFFVYTQAVAGIFYMAIIVSSLVAGRIKTFNRDKNE